MASSATFHHRARVASLTRDRAPDDPELIAARRDLAEANLTDYINTIIDAAPPLTSAQRSRLTALLSPVTVSEPEPVAS